MIFNRPKLYSVHINPEHEEPFETAEFVQEGFNIFAFIFNGFWMFYHKIWVSGIVIILLMGAIAALAPTFGFNPLSALVLRIGLQIMIGLEANDLRRKHLSKKGYIVSDVVAGSTLLDAQQRYFDRQFDPSRQVLARLAA